MSTRTVTVKNTSNNSNSHHYYNSNNSSHSFSSHSKHMNNHPSPHLKNSKKMNNTNSPLPSSPPPHPPRQYKKKDETKKLQATHRKNRRHQNKDYDDSSSNSSVTSSSSSSSSSGSDSDSYKSTFKPKRKPSPSFDSKSKLNSFGSSMTDQVYAGPTFNNAPVPSALPIPAFNARGSPISNHPQPLYMSVTPSLQQQSKDLMNLLLPPQQMSHKVVSAYELEQDLALSEIQRGLRSMLKIAS